MKKDIYKELKFVIGEQYENYEFDLECTCLERFTSRKYDCYKYIKDDFKTLFGLEITKDTHLIFNADILSAVYYRFEGNQYKYLRDKINSYLDKSMIESEFDTFIRAEVVMEDYSEDILELSHFYNDYTGLCFQNMDFQIFHEDSKYPSKLYPLWGKC